MENTDQASCRYSLLERFIEPLHGFFRVVETFSFYLYSQPFCDPFKNHSRQWSERNYGQVIQLDKGHVRKEQTRPDPENHRFAKINIAMFKQIGGGAVFAMCCLMMLEINDNIAFTSCH
jgi:hypothetical protein